jgi:hypothetical protein
MEQIPGGRGRCSIDGEAVRAWVAGSPLADYHRFVCSRGTGPWPCRAGEAHQEPRLALPSLRDVLDPRLDAFLSHFPEPEFRIERQPSTPCPYLPLPPSWEAYLDTGPRPRLRREIRHDLRAMERLGGFRRTSIQEGGERQIEILLDLWQGRCGFLPAVQLAQYRSVLVSCLASGSLLARCHWDWDSPSPS